MADCSSPNVVIRPHLVWTTLMTSAINLRLVSYLSHVRALLRVVIDWKFATSFIVKEDMRNVHKVAKKISLCEFPSPINSINKISLMTTYHRKVWFSR